MASAIAEAVQRSRKQLGLSTATLAGQARVATNDLEDLEAGKRPLSANGLVGIARAMGLPATAFLTTESAATATPPLDRAKFFHSDNAPLLSEVDVAAIMRETTRSQIFGLQDVGCLEALRAVVDCELILTDIVWNEVTRKPIVGTAAKTILAAVPSIRVHKFYADSPETLQFARLRAGYPESTYHDGELSVLALAAEDTALIPVIVERRGLVAACDELRRPVLTGHWFFSELHQKHGLSTEVFQKCVGILHSKGYPTPTWFKP